MSVKDDLMIVRMDYSFEMQRTHHECKTACMPTIVPETHVLGDRNLKRETL